MEAARTTPEENIQDRVIITENIATLNENGRVATDDMLNNDKRSLSEHNEQFSKLLKAYVDDFEKNSVQKRKNKEIIFKIAKNLLIWVPVAVFLFISGTLMGIIAQKIDMLEGFASLFTALGTLIGTFMMIPKMITRYLFNKSEEEHLAEIIGKIQEYDKNIRNGMQR